MAGATRQHHPATVWFAYSSASGLWRGIGSAAVQGQGRQEYLAYWGIAVPGTLTTCVYAGARGVLYCANTLLDDICICWYSHVLCSTHNLFSDHVHGCNGGFKVKLAVRSQLYRIGGLTIQYHAIAAKGHGSQHT